MARLSFPGQYEHGHAPVHNVNELFQEQLTFGRRAADAVANGMGSWRFIIIQSILLAGWIAVNVTAWTQHWDPYPFILMNLILSTQAAYAAPIIMMSQNRQAAKDRLEAHNDYLVNKRRRRRYARSWITSWRRTTRSSRSTGSSRSERVTRQLRFEPNLSCNMCGPAGSTTHADITAGSCERECRFRATAPIFGARRRAACQRFTRQNFINDVATNCAECKLASRSLRKPGARRTLFIAHGQSQSCTQRMRDKIDGPAGRRMYSQRMGIVEPVFGNIIANKKMNRFTLRGRSKIRIQWLYFSGPVRGPFMNIEKIATTRLICSPFRDSLAMLRLIPESYRRFLSY